MKQTVVVGVTSGIAAVKVPELIRLLRLEELTVEVVMTASAVKMIHPREFGSHVYSDLFEKNFDYKKVLKERKVDHIDLADRASLVVICPATANIIAKLAHGIADDFLTTMVLATRAGVLLCPSMNVHMWENPVVQENLERLRSRGFFILDPAIGKLACGYEGKGRLSDVGLIKDEIMALLKKSTALSGKKIIVTAGGTQEPIDAVRVITNRSSGKMGKAIADECRARGADVTLIRAKSAVSSSTQEKIFETTRDLFRILKEYAKTADIIFHVAAVSDFKIFGFKEKFSSAKQHTLKLKPTKKLLPLLKIWNRRALVIGFKAAYEKNINRLTAIARKKLNETHVDVIVANDISRSDRGFGADTNEVVIVSKRTSRVIPLATKREVAKAVVEYVLSLPRYS